MEQFKKCYKKYKTKFSNRPPDEIDFGLGFQAALELVESWLDYSTEHKEIKDKIHDELEGGD